MDISEIPLFAMLKSRLGYLGERQRLIAQNVANSDTPGYAAQDLKPFTFQAAMGAQGAAGHMALTQPGHMALKGGGAEAGLAPRFKSKKALDSETTLDGNTVVLEEEMMKMSDARMNYDAAISFYQKSLNLIRLAARAPGRG